MTSPIGERMHAWVIGVLLCGLWLQQTRCAVNMDQRVRDSHPVIVYSREILLQVRYSATQSQRTAWDRDARRTPGLLDQIPPELRKPPGRRKKRGRRGGVRRRLRARHTKPPLPSIILTNLRSINNKLDEIQAYTRYCSVFREASLLCFTESWLHSSVPDSACEIEGFTLVRADRDISSSKARAAGSVSI